MCVTIYLNVFSVKKRVIEPLSMKVSLATVNVNLVIMIWIKVAKNVSGCVKNVKIIKHVHLAPTIQIKTIIASKINHVRVSMVTISMMEFAWVLIY